MEFLTHSLLPLIRFGIPAMILLSGSCSLSPEKNNNQAIKDTAPIPRLIKKPPSSFSDTVIVDHESAVFFNPDFLQLQKIKSVNEKRVYETMTHDCYYMMQNARNLIREHWPRIPVVEVMKARYLLFIRKDQRKICIDLNAKNNICGVYLFDPKKDPEPVDMPNAATYLGFYFGNH